MRLVIVFWDFVLGKIEEYRVFIVGWFRRGKNGVYVRTVLLEGVIGY